jgi:hypothetical protein
VTVGPQVHSAAKGANRLKTRKWAIIAGIAGLVVCLALAILSYALAPRLKTIAQSAMETYLRDHFHGSVKFSDFDLSVYPRVRVTVSQLQIRHHERADIPALVLVRKVTFDTGILSLLRLRPEIGTVVLEGLQIRTPPKRKGGPPLIGRTNVDLAAKIPVVIGQVLADDALLVVLPSQAGKHPQEFQIHHLKLNNFSFDRPTNFNAILTNPVPKGEIDSTGEFGPWEAEEPSITPVHARYVFKNADMGTLKGLKGTLSSTGKFSGPLDSLDVEGVTDIPNFALRSGNPVPLHTDFSAFVDGTNGDVILKNVSAMLGHSPLAVKGEIVDLTSMKGRTIVLDAASQGGRIEDFLRLAVKSDTPLMVGTVKLTAKINIPEGDEDLVERMKLDGQFDVSDARFTSDAVQGKIDSLSRRSQGEPKDMEIGDAASRMQGKFKMEKGVIDFSNLSFGVAGADIALAGTYNLDSDEMDFRGKLKMKAKLSQTTTGMKSLFLKAADPFFKGKGAGTVIPIKITGTKDSPSFGLDFNDPANKK